MKNSLSKFLYLLDVGKWRRFINRFLTQARMAREQNNKSILRQALEQVGLYICSGITCKEYYASRLYRLPRKRQKEYLSEKLLKGKYKDHINPIRYWALTEDKLVFKRFIANAGFPTPKLYGVFDPGNGFIEGGGSLKTKEDLGNWFLLNNNIIGPVFKPRSGGQGDKVIVLNGKDDKNRQLLVHISGEKYTIDHLYHQLTKDKSNPISYIVEERIRQHAIIDEIFPKTVNSARCVTIRLPSGEIKVLGCNFRIGLGTTGVDNFSAGNIAVQFRNFREGILGYGVYKDFFEMKKLSIHPETKVKFQGVRLPFWKDVITLAISLARNIPGLNCIGWDIAITQDGPVVIEGNRGWGTQGIQIRKGIWTPELKMLFDSYKNQNL